MEEVAGPSASLCHLVQGQVTVLPQRCLGAVSPDVEAFPWFLCMSGTSCHFSLEDAHYLPPWVATSVRFNSAASTGIRDILSHRPLVPASLQDITEELGRAGLCHTPSPLCLHPEQDASPSHLCQNRVLACGCGHRPHWRWENLILP